MVKVKPLNGPLKAIGWLKGAAFLRGGYWQHLSATIAREHIAKTPHTHLGNFVLLFYKSYLRYVEFIGLRALPIISRP